MCNQNNSFKQKLFIAIAIGGISFSIVTIANNILKLIT